MSRLLSLVTDRLVSPWKPESPQTDRTSSQQNAVSPPPPSVVFERMQNHIISDRLPSCTICEATLEMTDVGEISFHSDLTGTVIHPDEKTLQKWLGDAVEVDIWKIRDLHEKQPAIFYELQRMGEWGYDRLETERKLYGQLSKEYGVLWKEIDQETGKNTYKRYRKSIFPELTARDRITVLPQIKHSA